MTTATATLADFLLARLSDDEAAALRADAGPWEDWNGSDAGGGVYVSGPHETFGIQPGKHGDDAYYQAEKTAAHIARHDPARVLADCAARRAIMHEFLTFKAASGRRAEGEGGLPQALTMAGIVTGLERALRHLAAPYASHESFDPAWDVS